MMHSASARAAGDAARDLAKAKAAAVRAALEAAADSPTAMKAEDAELGGGELGGAKPAYVVTEHGDE